MAMPPFADPANLVVEEEQRTTIPDDIPLPELADSVVRGKRTLSRDQMRLLIELLPYYLPKLSAVAHGHFEGTDFASALDRAIERSKQPVPLLDSPTEQLLASELKKPMQRCRRF